MAAVPACLHKLELIFIYLISFVWNFLVSNTNTECVYLWACSRACLFVLAKIIIFRYDPPFLVGAQKKKSLAQQYYAPSTQPCCSSNCARIEMEINSSRLSRWTHWCPLMANKRQIQMAPLECMTAGWFYRAAHHFLRSGASQWWMKQMLELSYFLSSSTTDWEHISVRNHNLILISLSDLYCYLTYIVLLLFS